ncbi:hypothetical protein DB459_12735 [Bradyrhizobium sp. WD16]|nr:hypothetical protein DB459_12735 [Bradyrhizobium sp. WD16]
MLAWQRSGAAERLARPRPPKRYQKLFAAYVEIFFGGVVIPWLMNTLNSILRCIVPRRPALRDYL